MNLIKSILIMVIFSLPVFARDIDKDYHERFNVKKGMKLHVKHGDGDVKITTWDKDVIDIEVKYHAKVQSLGIGKKNDFECEFRESGNIIHVIGYESNSIQIGYNDFNVYEYIYTIKAPAYIDLDLEGDDGSVFIEDWKGEINCNLEDGNIELRNILSATTDITIEDGDLEIEGLEGELYIEGEDGGIILVNCNTPRCRIYNQDGHIRIRKSEGEFEIKVDDARIELKEVRARFLDVRGNDGRVEVNLLKVKDINIEIKTGDGDINLELEEGISAEVSVNTDDGHIRVDLPSLKKSREGENWFSGEMYGGEGKIRLRTNDGSVKIDEFK